MNCHTVVYALKMLLYDVLAVIEICIARNVSGMKVELYPFHYENSPMQYTEIFRAVKTEYFIGKK